MCVYVSTVNSRVLVVIFLNPEFLCSVIISMALPLCMNALHAVDYQKDKEKEEQMCVLNVTSSVLLHRHKSSSSISNLSTLWPIRNIAHIHHLHEWHDFSTRCFFTVVVFLHRWQHVSAKNSYKCGIVEPLHVYQRATFYAFFGCKIRQKLFHQ